MNSLTTAENQQKLSEREIELGTVGTKKSWHNIYRESAWVFVGGLPFDLTEGDVICIFSQYGEIVNINMVRDKKTGKTKGYAFICYEDQRSTILAVDNFNTSKILQRTIRVDHVKDYRPPDQDDKNVDDVTKMVRAEGVAPRALTPDSENEGYLLPLSDKEHKKKNKAKKSKKEKKVKREKADVVIKEEPRHANQILNADVKETRRRPEEIRGRESDKYANARSCDDREQRRVADDRSDRPVPTTKTKEERGRWKSGHDMEPLKSHRRRRSPDARVEGKRDDLSQHTSARRRSRSPVNWHSHRRSRSRDRKQRRRSRSIERHKHGE